MQRIGSLVEGANIAGQEEPAVEEEVVVKKKEVLVVDVNKKDKEEDAKKESTKNIVTAPEFVGATTDNFERDGAKRVKATKKETNDARAKLKPEERFGDRVKPKEKNRKCPKDKKRKKEEKKRRKKKHHAATSLVKEN
ncbi:hypothetical protein PVK06_012036 [Gossypium arboreum]|uniref:Uncharacterized protein n=1 Tax=Gossypium arboreum TaxID=29729 RepID=A0ABR0QAF4_GOSAR|nr:hypothetical protein PVK06_012036 [Gossypium arboreum]